MMLIFIPGQKVIFINLATKRGNCNGYEDCR